MPKQDLIKVLGPLALASRLKRLSERLMKDVARLYKEMDYNMEPRWFPVLYLLGQKSPLAITEISKRLVLTHPAINQVAGQLEKAGLVKSRKDTADERRRLLSLTIEGKRLIKSLQPLWDDIKAVTGDIVAESGDNILDSISALEEALDRRDVYLRIRDRRRQKLSDQVDIVPYRPAYKKHFKRINQAWLREFFAVEYIDRKILEDPNGQILKKGGQVFFARYNGKIIGTAALLHNKDGSWELAKMGVLKKFRGRGVGYKLARSVIEAAKIERAKELILFTSPQLKDAGELYRGLGFRTFKSGKADRYKRCTITMKLKI